VPIQELAEQDGWEIREANGLGGMYGYSLIGEYDKLMRIDVSQPIQQQRFTIGHEIGHELNGDRWGTHYCQAVTEQFATWIWRRAEAQVSLVSARLQIPDWVWREEQDVETIAEACQVPVEAVLIAARNYRDRSHDRSHRRKMRACCAVCISAVC
jgi:Zn-dependent peptidase ImmA (M78 family)